MTKVSKKGFTLIEIVIVLAIAALIMVIVFLAVAGAQRAQRDNTNKSAAGQALSQAEQYLANNSGAYPKDTPVPTNYLSGIKTSTGSNPTSVAKPADAKATGDVIVVTNATCSSGTVMGSGTASQAAVSWYSENSKSAQCIGN